MEVVVIDNTEPVNSDDYIRPTKTEDDERRGKRPEWPMITADDLPA